MGPDVRVQRAVAPFPFASPFDGEEYALLLVVWATDVTPTDQQQLSAAVVASGCRYAVCVGHECSKWDDSIDLAAVLAELDGKRPSDKHIMTTWHADESLEEAVDFFFTHSAFDDFAPARRLALALGGTQEQEERLKVLVEEWRAAERAGADEAR